MHLFEKRLFLGNCDDSSGDWLGDVFGRLYVCECGVGCWVVGDGDDDETG